MTVRLIHDKAYTVEHSATVLVWHCLAPEASSALTVFMITVGPVLRPWPGNTPPISPSTHVMWGVCMFADLFFHGEVSFRYLALTGNGARPTLSGEDVGCDQEGG